MKTREEIITSMCYTWRHDYGLLKEASPESFIPGLTTAGMTREEQQSLWQRMAQIFDNDIAPHMELKMIPWYRRLLYILVAPFIIGAWCIMNPRKVWEQAKKDFGVE